MIRQFKRPVVWLTFGITVVSTVVFFLFTKMVSDAHVRGMISNEGAFLTLKAEEEIVHTEYALNALTLFYENSGVVTSKAFDTVAEGLLRTVHGTRGFGWIPVVAESGRAAFASAARRTDPAFVLHDINGTAVAPGTRPVYYPIYYVFPKKGNESTVGFDYGSDPVRSQLLRKVLAECVTTASPPLTLYGEPPSQKGFVLLTPIQTPTGDCSLGAGMAIAAFRYGELFDTAIRSLSLSRHFFIRLYDATSSGHPEEIYRINTDLRDDTDGRFLTSHTFSLAGRKWRIDAAPTEAYIAGLYPDAPAYVLIFGLLMSLLLVGVLIAVGNKQRQLEEANEALLQASQQREASEKRLQTFIDEAPVGIVMLNQDAMAYVNAAAQRVTGWSLGELIGRSYMEIVAAEDREAVLADYRRLKEAGERTVSNETRLSCPDGSLRLISYAAIRDPADENGIFITMNDITEARAAEEKIRTERDTAQRYLDIVPVVVLVLDKAGEIRLINRKGCEVVGYENDRQLIGKNWFETFILPEDRPAISDIFQAMMQQSEAGAYEVYENPVIGRTGKEHQISWRLKILTDDYGTVTGLLGSGLDITEMRRYEQQLEEQLAELRRFSRLAVGRELRMKALQQEIERLKRGKSAQT